ncbi:MAG: alpha/beta hydrolase, partial [Terriglobales bacterium]
HLPIVVAGFSFGAWVGLHACCPDPRVVALISLGTPVDVEGHAYAYAFLRECSKPKLFVSGARDEFGPLGEVERIEAMAVEPKRLVRVPGADHFFEGRLPALQEAIEDWLRTAIPGAGERL